MKTRSSLLIACVLSLKLTTASAESSDIENIVGKWSNDNTGETYLIVQNFNGWDLFHSKDGQFALTSDGQFGSNIKMSGRSPKDSSSLTCYYYVSINSKSSMTWGLRNGPSTECYVGKFTRVPTRQELIEQQAQAEAEEKQAEAVAAAAVAKSVAEKQAAAAKEQLALEATKRAVEAKSVADAQAAQRLEEAKRKRLADEAALAAGPSELAGVDLVYFERSQDEGLVKSALDDNKVAYSTRRSSDQAPSDVLTCTPDVDIAAIKKIGNILLDAGLNLYGIEKSIHPEFTNRVTIESYFANGQFPRPPITSRQLSKITSCGLNVKVLSVSNDCSLPLQIFAHYQRSADGIWVTEYGGQLAPGQMKALKNPNGERMETDSKAIYYYAFANRPNRRPVEFDGSGSNVFVLPGSSSPKSFMASDSTKLQGFACQLAPG